MQIKCLNMENQENHKNDIDTNNQQDNEHGKENKHDIKPQYKNSNGSMAKKDCLNKQSENSETKEKNVLSNIENNSKRREEESSLNKKQSGLSQPENKKDIHHKTNFDEECCCNKDNKKEINLNNQKNKKEFSIREFEYPYLLEDSELAIALKSNLVKKCGYGYKKKSYLSYLWSRKYFVLTDNLYYYGNMNGKGTLFYNLDELETVSDEYKETLSHKFKILLGGKKNKFIAFEDEKTRNEWKKRLNEEVEMRQKNGKNE